MTPLDFHSRLMAFCDALGGSQTSGKRTAARNARVGGVEHSKHQIWLAADVAYDDPKPSEARRLMVAKQLGLQCLIESDHDHLQAPS